MKILIISFDSLQEWNDRNNMKKKADELTDEEFAQINEDYEDGWCFNSFEEFTAFYNNYYDNAPIPDTSLYIRAVKETKTFFEITSVHRDDLERLGYDTSKVSDQTMEKLATKMSDDYLEQLFWTSLDIIAEDLGIPKKTDEQRKKEALEAWGKIADEADWTPTGKEDGTYDILLEIEHNGKTFLFVGNGTVQNGKRTVTSLKFIDEDENETILI